MDFVVERSSSRDKLMAQLQDIGRYPDSHRDTVFLDLRVDNVSKDLSGIRQRAWVLVDGLVFPYRGSADSTDHCIIVGRFTRRFDGVIGTNWWAERPFRGTLDLRRRRGKISVLNDPLTEVLMR